MRQSTRVAAIIVKDDKVLLIHSHDSKIKGTNVWVPPGGGLKHDETIPAGAMREAREETGLKVKPGKLIYFRHCHDINNDIHGAEFYFLATPIGGKLSPQDDPDGDIAEARWFTKEDMARATVYPEELRDLFWKDLKENFKDNPKDGGLRVF